MRQLLVFTIFLGSFTALSADCIFSTDGLVQNLQTDIFQENEGLVWVGEKLEEIVDEANFVRMTRMKVIEVWCGEIQKMPVTGSPDWAFDYLNTDDEVFIYSPYGTSQDFSIPEGRFIIGSQWYDMFYSVSNCQVDMLPVDVGSNSVTGNLHGQGSIETLPIETVKNEIIGDSSCTTGLGIEAAPFNVNVFPNPSEGIFNVQLGESANAIEIGIHSIDGKLVSRQTANNGNFNVDISNLNPGVYILDLLIDEQFLYRTEVVKF